MTPIDKLKTKLAELFQLDQADLGWLGAGCRCLGIDFHISLYPGIPFHSSFRCASPCVLSFQCSYQCRSHQPPYSGCNIPI